MPATLWESKFLNTLWNKAKLLCGESIDCLVVKNFENKLSLFESLLYSFEMQMYEQFDSDSICAWRRKKFGFVYSEYKEDFSWGIDRRD
jgi:hypothetical protein